MSIRKSTMIIAIVVVISVLSLGLSIYSLSKTESNKGIAQEDIRSFEVQLKDIRDYNYSMNTSFFEKEPVIERNIVKYSVFFTEEGAYNQFYFTLRNDGTKDIVVENIEIKGLDDYKDYVSVRVEGINVDDVIKSSSDVNVKVVTTYDKNQYDEEGSTNIKLDNIYVVINCKE